MKSAGYIYPLKSHLSPVVTGNKAQSLLFLKRKGYRIPATWVVSAKACDDFRSGVPSVLNYLKSEIENLPDAIYAVRSSALAEDSVNHTYAGLFRTLTNIQGRENILNAVKDVWESAELFSESEHFSRFGDDQFIPKCAVLIQKMVKPVLSGVSFSKNPITNLNEIIVEAVEGPGDNLVQKGFSPLRWRFKEMILLEGDESYHRYNVISSVANATAKLKKAHGSHVDIEWVFDGREVYFLQLREITGPNNQSVYSNRMAREMLPGQIKPLVWSVNIPLVNGTWIQLLSEITGKVSIMPEELAKSFYYRTYFNITALGRLFREVGFSAESLEYMILDDKRGMTGFRPGIKVFRHTIRIIRFLRSKLYFSKTFQKQYDELKRNYRLLKHKIKYRFTLQSFPELYDELFYEGRKLAYLNIVVPLLMQVYNKRLKKRLKKIGADYDKIDFARDFPILEKLSPADALNQLRLKFDQIPIEVRIEIDTLEKLKLSDQAFNLLEDFDEFMEKFGHLSQSGNDFSIEKWEENPEFIFQLIRQSPVSVPNSGLIAFRDLGYSKLRHPGLMRLYRNAGKYRVYREQISSLYIFGYGLFRIFFVKVGREFVNLGIIEKQEDIFYLDWKEIDSIIRETAKSHLNDYKSVVNRRKTEMEDSKDIQLPTVIYGDEPPVLEKRNLKNLSGVGTSPGKYTGRTRIIKDIQHFNLIKRGDVLVIPFSDVSWMPVLVLAGAIVSESGGMLSHCSIIARELGIPAITSVENACGIENDQTVTVDGSNGILTIHADE